MRRHLTPGNVLSALLLFVVLGGSAYAASTLAPKSVGTKQLKRNAVTTAKVRDGSLRLADIRPGEVNRLRGAQGPEGPQGPPGPPADLAFAADRPGGLVGAGYSTFASLTGPGGSGRIALPETGRLYTTGVVSIFNTATAANEADCQVQVETPAGSGSFADAGNRVFQDFPNPSTTGTLGGYDEAIPLNAVSDPLPPGSYDVRVRCLALDGVGLAMEGVQFTVIAR